MYEKWIIDKARAYAMEREEAGLKSDERRMKSPVLYILLGDRAKEGLPILQQSMNEAAMNAEGAVYLVVQSERIERTERSTPSNVLTLSLPTEKLTGRRGDLYTYFESETFLKQLNQVILETKQCILEKAKVFNYWEQIEVSVITAASDPMNSLMADLVILLKSKLEQDFKQIFLDLFVLLEEAERDSTALNKALAYSFFKELEAYQSVAFQYEKELELLEDGIRLKVTYESVLFNLVYLLSDKKETGQKIEKALENHYETIAAVQLLKNREQKRLDLEEAREQYNQNIFASNIGAYGQKGYCSARLARVKKPCVGIYLAVVHQLFKAYFNEVVYEGEQAALLSAVGLTDESITRTVQGSLKEAKSLEEIYALISRNVSYKTLRGLSFKEAETQLYGEGIRQFFDLNFEKVARGQLQTVLDENALMTELGQVVMHHPGVGPFVLEILFESESMSQLALQKEKYAYRIKEYERVLDEKENQIVGMQIGTGFSFLEKKFLRETKAYLIHEIYETKYHCLLEQLKFAVLEKRLSGMATLKQKLSTQLKRLQNLEQELLEALEEAHKYEEAYLVQNVKEYYEQVVKEKLQALKEEKGMYFLYDEKYIGPIAKVLVEEEETFLNKLFEIAEKEILQDEAFFELSFEDELLARANMLVSYDNTEVVAKSELYNLLYTSLEENSKPCVHLDTTLSPHRYEEKYFFGARASDLIQYAYQRDQVSRSYKIGTIDNKGQSSIAKLQLMGGFKLEELIFTRSARRYYEAYQEKGYSFHQIKERGEEDGTKTF